MPATCVVSNPYSGDRIQEIPWTTPAQAAQAVQKASAAFQRWKHAPSSRRSQLLLEAADSLEGRHEEFAELIQREAGKPIALARIEVQRAIGVLRWSAAEALRFGGEVLRLDTTGTNLAPGAVVEGRLGMGLSVRFPRGPVLGITPFNFPLNLTVHKVAPALACGSSIVIKPSPFAPLSAFRFAELFAAEPDLVQVTLPDDALTAKLTQDPTFRFVSFTGSPAVGWAIRRQAPEKPMTLELGGNAWCIVLGDHCASDEATLATIAKKICAGGYSYAGQSCISVQNVAVARPLFERMRAHLERETREFAYGDPSLVQALCGPVIHEGAAKRVRALLQEAPRDGFTAISSEKRLGAEALTLIPPALLTGAQHTPSSALKTACVGQEAFAPLITLIPFDQTSDLIQSINRSNYGLQAGIFTRDFGEIARLYRELEVGGLVVNDIPTTRYDHQPYGGVKDSGLGREGPRYAMEEMTETKFLAL